MNVLSIDFDIIMAPSINLYNNMVPGTKWDDLLNSIYGVLKTQLSESEMNSLRNKQKAWIKYRDSEADKAFSEYEGGTMAPLEATSVNAELTRQRCYELVNQYMN